ncbi:hypothetical protein [Neobacillus sp. NPDC093127]|uniref:hypothetical protein n=1 Tax=Neobacillus sp. NPDC093127 TaxID=3364296 RepID=UPI003820E611
MTDNEINTLKNPNIPLSNRSLKKNNSTDNTAKNMTTLTVFFRKLTCQNVICKKYRFQFEIGTVIN